MQHDRCSYNVATVHSLIDRVDNGDVFQSVEHVRIDWYAIGRPQYRRELTKHVSSTTVVRHMIEDTTNPPATTCGLRRDDDGSAGISIRSTPIGGAISLWGWGRCHATLPAARGEI